MKIVFAFEKPAEKESKNHLKVIENVIGELLWKPLEMA